MHAPRKHTTISWATAMESFQAAPRPGVEGLGGIGNFMMYLCSHCFPFVRTQSEFPLRESKIPKVVCVGAKTLARPLFGWFSLPNRAGLSHLVLLGRREALACRNTTCTIFNSNRLRSTGSGRPPPKLSQAYRRVSKPGPSESGRPRPMRSLKTREIMVETPRLPFGGECRKRIQVPRGRLGSAAPPLSSGNRRVAHIQPPRLRHDSQL